MRKLVFLALAGGMLWYFLTPQWRSFERMGERRHAALSRPAQEILVGICWPFSVNRDGMGDGLELALEEINSGGLARGIPMRLVVRDDAFDWDKAKRIAIEFSGNPNMSAVLGYYDDSVALKASMMYETSRLLHIIIGANSTPMTARGLRYIVRTIVSSEKIASSLARISLARGHKNIALIWEEDAYGEDLAYQYRVALDSMGAQLAYQWSYSREHPDFRTPVNQLKENGADLVFFAGLEPWAGDFLREARGVGLKMEIIGAFSDTPEMRARAGGALDGAMYFDEYNPLSASRENQKFVGKFRARFGRLPDTWAAQGYDALHILAQAVQSTGSAEPLDLSYAIRFMDAWEGANGRYKFDSRGELEDKPLFLNAYRHGTPVTIQETAPLIR